VGSRVEREVICDPQFAPGRQRRGGEPGHGAGAAHRCETQVSEARAWTRASLGCTPSMGTDQEVKVLRGLGHRDPREPQGDAREGSAEGSGKRTGGPTNRNRIRGGADQGERATDREALVTKGRRRKSGGRVGKASALIWGDLASRLKGRRGREPWSEKSAEAVVRAGQRAGQEG